MNDTAREDGDAVDDADADEVDTDEEDDDGTTCCCCWCVVVAVVVGFPSVEGAFRVGTGGGGAARPTVVDDDAVVEVEDVAEDNMDVALAVADANAEAEMVLEDANGCFEDIMGRFGIRGFVASSVVIGRECEVVIVGFAPTCDFAAEVVEDDAASGFAVEDNNGRLE